MCYAYCWSCCVIGFIVLCISLFAYGVLTTPIDIVGSPNWLFQHKDMFKLLLLSFLNGTCKWGVFSFGRTQTALRTWISRKAFAAPMLTPIIPHHLNHIGLVGPNHDHRLGTVSVTRIIVYDKITFLRPPFFLIIFSPTKTWLDSFHSKEWWHTDRTNRLGGGRTSHRESGGISPWGGVATN